jgi:two-component sensor histidine kinase
MRATQSSEIDRDENDNDLALLLAEINHRIRNLLMMIEAAVRQTQSTSVEDYRAKLILRLSALGGFYRLNDQYGRAVALERLLDETMRPYATAGGRVVATGPDIELEPRLALALHLVIHELAANAHKYGALSSAAGHVNIEWAIRHVSDADRKLTIAWSEHGGPEVKPPGHRGFGSRLVRRALEGYGAVRLDFNRSGVACFILINLDRSATQTAMHSKGPDRITGRASCAW